MIFKCVLHSIFVNPFTKDKVKNYFIYFYTYTMRILVNKQLNREKFNIENVKCLKLTKNNNKSFQLL